MRDAFASLGRVWPFSGAFSDPGPLGWLEIHAKDWAWLEIQAKERPDGHISAEPGSALRRQVQPRLLSSVSSPDGELAPVTENR